MSFRSPFPPCCGFSGEGGFPLLFGLPSAYLGCLSSQTTPSHRAKLSLRAGMISSLPSYPRTPTSTPHQSVSFILPPSPLLRMQALRPEAISSVSTPCLPAGPHHQIAESCLLRWLLESSFCSLNCPIRPGFQALVSDLRNKIRTLELNLGLSVLSDPVAAIHSVGDGALGAIRKWKPAVL